LLPPPPPPPKLRSGLPPVKEQRRLLSKFSLVLMAVWAICNATEERDLFKLSDFGHHESNGVVGSHTVMSKEEEDRRFGNKWVSF